MKTALASFAIALLGSVSSQAASTLDYEFGVLNKLNGGTLSSGSIVFLYVSTTGNAIDGQALRTSLVNTTLTAGSSLGNGNIIIDVSAVNNSLGAGTGNDSAVDVLYVNGITSGDALGLIWFEQTAGPIGYEVAFGFATTSVVMPTDPTSDFFDLSGSRTSTLRTIADPIPEPSAVLLGAIGALGLLRRRRI